MNQIIVGHYDFRLVALSMAIAVCASYTALDMTARTAGLTGRSRIYWSVGGAFSMGLGIWAMHYIGMLAFRLPVTISYNPPSVLFSFLAAVVASAVALWVVSRKHESNVYHLGGSLCMGSGIAAMHYLGMSAMRLEAHMEYNRAIVAWSVVIAIVVSYVALRVAFRFRDRARGSAWPRLASSCVMGLAIASMHYVGMAAVCFHRMPMEASQDNALTVSDLGVFGIAALTFLVLGLSVVGSMADRSFRSQSDLLRSEQERWRLLMSSSLDGLFDADLVTGKVFYSPRWLAILGYGPDELEVTDETWRSRIHPTELEQVDAWLKKYLSRREGASEMEYRLRHRNGSWRWVSVRAQAVWDRDGRPLRLVGTHSDVTERKDALLALKASERQFGAFMENNPVLAAIKDADGRMSYANLALERMFGLESGQWIGKLDYEIWPAESADGGRATDLEVLTSGKQAELTEQAYTPDGALHHFIKTKFAFQDALGRTLLGVVAVDITAQVNTKDELRRLNAVMETLVTLRTEELRTSEARWRGLVESLPQLVWTTKPDGYCDYLSNQWIEYTGIPLSEQVGAGWQKALHPDDCERVGEAWLAAVGGKGHYDVEYRIRAKDGSYRWFKGRGCAVRPLPEGPITHWIGTSTDIEDQKRSEERLEAAVAQRTLELAEARDRAESATQVKSSFLASMSHEIRTPMNGVIGMTTLMMETPLSSDQRTYLDGIRSSGEALLTIINDILDFSKIEAGKMELENINFDLQTILEESIELVATSLKAKGLNISLEVEDQVPLNALGDPGRLRQILLNLLSNAVKFTERGSISLRVSRESNQSQVTTLRFAVRDTGIGLTPQHQTALFQAFTQADSSTTRRFGGTGLGLSIAKRLVELMGGTIGVSSHLGEGATFWFNICLHAGSHACSDHVLGRTVFLLDDQLVERTAVRRYLERAGAEVYEGGQEAADLASLSALIDKVKIPISLLLIDTDTLTRRPELRLLRTLPKLNSCPVIILGTAPPGRGAEFCQIEGATFLSKPIRYLQLVRTVQAALGGEDPLCEAYATCPSLGRYEADVLLVEDNRVSQIVARHMLESLGCRVVVAQNGFEACAAVKASRYQVIFMDCQMPGMDGFETTKQIRNAEVGSQRTPIVALTAGVLKEERDRCYEAGMDDFLSKPIAKPQLAAALGTWLLASK